MSTLFSKDRDLRSISHSEDGVAAEEHVSAPHFLGLPRYIPHTLTWALESWFWDLWYEDLSSPNTLLRLLALRKPWGRHSDTAANTPLGLSTSHI